MAIEAIDALLSAVASGLRSKDAKFLRKVLTIDTDQLLEPPYSNLGDELREHFPWDAEDEDENLEEYCEQRLPTDSDWTSESDYGQAWPAFVVFLKEYLIYIRDHSTTPVAEYHEYVYILFENALTALSHPTLGFLLLDACQIYGYCLKKLSVHLDSPEWRQTTYEVRLRLVREKQRFYSLLQKPGERAAELLQKAVGICLTDRTGGGGPANRFARVEGKRTAIYFFANLVAQCMQACNVLSTCTQMYTNIQQMAPPLTSYPASQRVIYLYHLGRFHASLESNYRASLCLEAAYHQCPAMYVGHRRRILRFLIAVNITLGRFPSRKLFSRPEAVSLEKIYIPICNAIRQGDFRSLRQVLGGRYEDDPDTLQPARKLRAYLGRIGVLFMLKIHCELITWRCLVRKTFLIAGFHGEGKKAPTMSIDDVRIVAEFLDPALVWPLGKKPWYQDIDRNQWVEQEREKWGIEMRNWEIDPDRDVERWQWEPDIKGPRLRRKLPPGEAQPEFLRPAKNESEKRHWFKLEIQRLRMLVRYYQMYQIYHKFDPPSDTDKLAWWRKHNIPGKPVRWETPQVMVDWFRKSVKLQQKGQTLWHNPANTAKLKVGDAKNGTTVEENHFNGGPISEDEEMDTSMQEPQESLFLVDPPEKPEMPVLTAEMLSAIPPKSPKYMKEPTLDQVLAQYWGTEWGPRGSVRPGSPDSFDSIQAARGLWTGGTYCQSEPAMFPRDIPDRDYAPSRPETPPEPLDTDMFMFDQLGCLISQGLLHGFLSWRLKKFGITGAKQHGALEAGFPTVWPMLKRKMEEQDEAGGFKAGYVPAWVREEYEKASRSSMRTGGVVRLTGARAVGE